jgi:hypothetical protein
MSTATITRFATLSLLFSLLVACGGGDNSGGGGVSAPTGFAATVSDSLNQLGVPMTQSPRLSNDCRRISAPMASASRWRLTRRARPTSACPRS